MIHEDTNFTSKNIQKHHCKFCDFGCSKIGDWNRHKTTLKHKKEEERYKMIQNDTTKTSIYIHQYVCDCGKEYKHHSGLWRHKKQCTYQDSKMETTNVAHSDEINELKEFMKYLMQENSEMKNMMMEVIKNGTISNTNSHNTNNSHNKAAL